MRFVPHEYQRLAFEWIISHPRCLLFLEMGLGKTVVCLSAVKRLARYGEAEKVLVIAPKKVAESTWSSEAAQWDHLAGLRVSNVIGGARQRNAALEADADIYVIGRDSVVWLCERYKKKFPFDMVIIDELTSFKNPSSLRFKALRRVLGQVPRVVGLTGTPTPQGLPDLWAQVYCIDGGERLGKYVTHFRERWFTVITHNNVPIRIIPKKGAKEEILSAISDIALAMRAEDWLKLPPLIAENVPVRLDEATMKRYREFETEKVLEFKKTGEPLLAGSSASLVNKLSQYANGAIYTDNLNEYGDREVIEIHDEKLKALQDIYESEDNSPILVFYQYKHDRDRILSYFDKLKESRLSKKLIPSYYDTLDRPDRDRGTIEVYRGPSELSRWNKGYIGMLLLHPASAAFGLNMQFGGRRIVWFSTGWKLELYQQANARLYRQGQKYPVRVFHLVAQGTVDERMVAALTGKGAGQRDIVNQLAAAIIADHEENEKQNEKKC